jgi:hypothetical protein
MKLLAQDERVPSSISSDLQSWAPGNEGGSCAESVVLRLLHRASLARFVDRGTLSVAVGEGNWISFSFRMKTGVEPASLEAIASLRRTARATVRPDSKKSTWFRGKGSPCLHFEILPADRRRENIVRGHVDAADPWTHPVAHLLRDYLPARGFGQHPAPVELLDKLKAPAAS